MTSAASGPAETGGGGEEQERKKNSVKAIIGRRWRMEEV
jgi:hypothetical protein